ncbi:GNAT family N-acetyltransferase [Oceanirhabdus sp. W0125-5]|uniref:GNAT family N-acetyltransferase n=1 Tax=Oceanirhabdus sp. W0125-5 TaxID=2999116 RepID=UPI0022F2DC11|nr:GNAT family N-acetyltransferase [Oceanirhabdus sp. W0125-5]WBW97191.1 GNAT family N-acetyltransferase [Oceanirhabdus sp. W0125-5]
MKLNVKDIRIEVLEKAYLEEAVDLFIENYKEFLIKHSIAPLKYREIENVTRLINYIIEKGYGVVAIIDKSVVGFLACGEFSEYKCSNKGTFIPEWGHAAIKENRQEIYQMMYERISLKWQEEGCVSNCITCLGHDKEVIDGLFMNGYGMLVIDAVRKPTSIENCLVNAEIRQAEYEDIKHIEYLIKEFKEYMFKAPICLNINGGETSGSIEEWINDDEITLWVAEYDGEIVGIMKTVINGDNACTIVRDNGTVSVEIAHITDKVRGLGIGKLLLNKANEWTIDNGYERMSVDFESMNMSARRFWLKHFEPVCYSLIRYFDDRVVKQMIN